MYDELEATGWEGADAMDTEYPGEMSQVGSPLSM